MNKKEMIVTGGILLALVIKVIGETIRAVIRVWKAKAKRSLKKEFNKIS